MAIPNARHYLVQGVIAPSTLTANTVYLSIRNTANPAASPPPPLLLGLKEVLAQTLFTGTNAASGSVLGIQRVSGQTPTGGATITPFSINSAAVAADVEVRFSNSGLATVTPSGLPFHRIGLASQVGQGTAPPLWFEDENLLLLNPGDCLLLYAHSAIASGSQFSGLFRWFQVVN